MLPRMRKSDFDRQVFPIPNSILDVSQRLGFIFHNKINGKHKDIIR